MSNTSTVHVCIKGLEAYWPGRMLENLKIFYEWLQFGILSVCSVAVICKLAPTPFRKNETVKVNITYAYDLDRNKDNEIGSEKKV